MEMVLKDKISIYRLKRLCPPTIKCIVKQKCQCAILISSALQQTEAGVKHKVKPSTFGFRIHLKK